MCKLIGSFLKKTAFRSKGESTCGTKYGTLPPPSLSLEESSQCPLPPLTVFVIKVEALTQKLIDMRFLLSSPLIITTDCG